LSIDRVAKVFKYGPCYVSKVTFSASAADPLLKMSMEIECGSETVGNSGTWAGTSQITRRPFIFSDSASGVTIAGSTYTIFGFELTLDNRLLANRFVNELYRSSIPATDRLVTCKLTLPYTSTESGLYGVAVGSFGSASIVMANAEETISSTVSTLTFTMGGLFQYPARSPSVTGKANEIHLELDGVARKSGSTAELSITNAHG
jgi:hypothetical protein